MLPIKNKTKKMATKRNRIMKTPLFISYNIVLKQELQTKVYKILHAETSEFRRFQGLKKGKYLWEKRESDRLRHRKIRM